MESYVCERCGHTSKHKRDALRHLNRKYPCPPLLSQKSTQELAASIQNAVRPDKTVKCACGKGFKTHASMNYHKAHHCRGVGNPTSVDRSNEQPNSVVEQMLALQTQMLQLQEQIKTLSSGQSGQNHTTINATTTNNSVSIGQQVNVVMINSFGNENLEHITPQFIEQCVRRRDKGLIELLERIHFSDGAPENNNVKVASMKRSEVQVFDGDRWKYHDKDRVVKDMVNAGHGIMQEHFDDNESSLRERVSLSLFQAIQMWLEGVHEEESDIIKPLMRDVFNLIKTYSATGAVRGT